LCQEANLRFIISRVPFKQAPWIKIPDSSKYKDIKSQVEIMNMLVKDVMRRKVLTVGTGTSIKAASRTLVDNRIGCLIVVKNSKVIGILTETDILRFLAESERCEIESECVEDVMTHYVIPITSGSSVESAVKLMIENKIKKLPVIDNDKLVGIITASDIITAQPAMIKGIRRLISLKYAAK